MWLRRLLLLGLLAVAGNSLLAQTDPAWWSGVIRTGDSHAISDNYAPANLGQLKNFADKARLHLDNRLSGSGGAGSAINGLIAGWSETTADNYAPINLGQLKFVADKFYARLDAVGFDFKSQLIFQGYGGVWTTIIGGYERPWNESAAIDTNYATANLGQLKILFSFDLSNLAPYPSDTDEDGILDVDESGMGLIVGKKDNPAVKLQVSVIVQ